jgi:hypothetical protein
VPLLIEVTREADPGVALGVITASVKGVNSSAVIWYRDLSKILF